MPKRKKETKEDRWRRKLKRYEDKLNKHDVDDAAAAGTMSRSVPAAPLPAAAADPPAPAAPGALAEPADHVLDLTTQRAPMHAYVRAPAHTLAPAPDVGSVELIDNRNASADTALTSQPDTLPVTSSATNPAVTTSQDTENVDPDLLQALGVFEPETTKWGLDIYGDLAVRWEPLLREGLKKESKDVLFKKYLPPKNCPLIKSATLNPEIGAMLNESAKNRDSRIIKKQDQLGCVLTILGRTMTDVLKKSINTSDILSNLSDAAKLLADSHYLETETRRSLVTPMIDKNYIEPFKDRKRDSHLFGEKLGDFIKSSRGIQKTGKLIQSEVASSPLNPRGPPARQYQNRGSRTHANRVTGGGKAFTQSMYRPRTPYQAAAVHPHPPPPYRPPATRQRQPPPPPATTKRKQ